MFTHITNGTVLAVIILLPFPSKTQEIPYQIVDSNQLKNIANKTIDKIKQNPSDLNYLKSAGIAYYQLAKQNDKISAKKARQYLENVIRLSPQDALMHAYAGATFAMEGRYEDSIIFKIDKINHAISLLNQAVVLDPNDLRIRLIRAGITQELPLMFHQNDVAENDYLVIANAASGGVGISKETLAMVYYRLILICKQKNETLKSKEFLEKLAALAPDSDWLRKARNKLNNHQ
jgi:hypothetical protein